MKAVKAETRPRNPFVNKRLESYTIPGTDVARENMTRSRLN